MNGEKPFMKQIVSVDLPIILLYSITALLTIVGFKTVLIWPAAGVACGAAVIWGTAAWRGVFVGSMISNTVWALLFHAPILTGPALLSSFGISGGNAIATLAVALILQKTKSSISFSSPSDVLSFGVKVAIGYAFVSMATGGVSNIPWNPTLSLSNWFISNLCGGLTVAPVLILWYSKTKERALSPEEWRELFLMVALIVAAWLILFGSLHRYLPSYLHIETLYILPLFWVAIRFSSRLTVTLSLITFLLAWWGTSQGMGLFSKESETSTALMLQIFVAAMSTIVLFILGMANSNRSALQKQEKQEQLNTELINSLPQNIFLKDKNSVYLSVNNSYAVLLGRKPEDIVGKNDFDLFGKELAEKYVSDDQTLLAEGKSAQFEEMLESNGVVTTIHTEKIVLTNVHGEPERILGIFWDTTEQEEILESKREMRFKELFNAIDDAIFIVDFDGAVLETNLAAQERLGYDADEQLTWAMIDGPAPSDRTESIADILATLSEKGKILFEGTHLTKSGTVIPVEINARVLEYRGKPAIISLARDITVRKKMENTHHELQMLLEQLVENSPSMICINEPDGKYRLVNRQFEMTLGLDREQILGKTDSQLFPPVIADDLRGNDLRAIQMKQAITTEDILPINGENHYFISTRFPLLSPDNEVVATCAVITDITEGRAMEFEKNQFFTMTNDFVGVADFNGMFLMVNPAMPAALGYSMDELCSTPFLEIIHPDDQEKTLSTMEGLTRGETINDFENRYVTKDGDVRWLSWRSTPDVENQRIYFIARDVTKNREMESAVSALHDRLSLAKKAGGIGIWDWDVKQNNLIWDEEMYALYGVTRETFSGAYEAWTAGLHPDEVEQANADIAAALAGERDFAPEFRVCWPDKSIHYIQAYATTFRNDSGDPLRMVGINYDITERKMAEQALVASEHSLHDAQRLAGIGSYNLNIQTGIWGGTPMLNSIFGIDDSHPHSIDGWMQIIHPDWMEKMELYFREIILGSRAEFNMEYPVVRKSDSVVRWVHGLGTIECNQYGEPIRMFGTIADITERKRTEDELREREEKFRFLTEFTSDVVWILNISQQRFTYISPSVFYLRGLSAEDAILQTLDEAVMPEFREMLQDKIKADLQRFLANPYLHEYYTTELQQPCADGAVIWVEVVTQFRFNSDGEIEIVGVSRNIENRKKMEARLIAAKDDADAANRSKSEFLANMSHEIRTPLNAVIGFSELLSTEVTDPRQKNYLTTIRNSGKALLQLINDILDLSKIEAGKMLISQQPSDINQLITDIASLFTLTAEQKGIAIRAEIDPWLPTTLILDENHIRQILINIVGNALKFTESGTVTVRASGYAEQSGGYVLKLFVIDTGIGIPEEQQAAVFENFRQQDGQSRRKYGGTGLGLAIAKNLVELQGGTIELYSVVGEGTTFTLTIPVDVAISAPSTSGNSWTSQQFNGETVLVVDDISTNREYIQEVLSRCNLTVVTVESGVEAVAYCTESTPALVLLDIRMPVMNGFDTIEQLKLLPLMNAVPIIALTASSTTEDARKSSAYGFAAFLSKPIEPARLIESIALYIAACTVPVVLTIASEEPIEVVGESVDYSEEVARVVPFVDLIVAAISPLQFGELETITEEMELVVSHPVLKRFVNELRDRISAMDIVALMDAPDQLKKTIDLISSSSSSGK